MCAAVAPNVQKSLRRIPAPRPVSPLRPMNKEFQVRFTAVMLALVTASAMVLAWINFQKEREFQVPSDGVWWVEHVRSEEHTSELQSRLHLVCRLLLEKKKK